MIHAVVLLIVLLTASVVDAATLYVNNSGSPACSNATAKASNTASAPWCTIARAAWGDGYAGSTYASPNTSDTAQAGDTVLITAGTYNENGSTTVGGDMRWSVALNPANSGSSGNLITFRGVGTVEIRLNDTIRGPVIGCNDRDYIVWDHVTVNDYYGGGSTDTGPAVFHVTTGCQLINSTVSGHTGSYAWGYATYIDNYSLVRLEYADFMTVKNNTIHRAHNHATGSGTRNQTGITTYDSSDNVIEHNEIYDTGNGIYVKGYLTLGQFRNVVRYNYLHDNDYAGITVQDLTTAHFYQNVLVDNQYGIYHAGRSGVYDSTSGYIINNTVVGGAEGIYTSSGIVTSYNKNNIVSGSTHAQFAPCTVYPDTNNVEFDRNLYYGYSVFGNLECVGTYSFATWQGTYSKDANGVNGSDPLFVATGSGPAYYKLQGGSPALTLGRVVESIGGTNGDTIPAGAYITGNETIGLETAASGTSTISGGSRFTGSVRIQ